MSEQWFQVLCSYGALGIVTIYFMVKDYKLNDSIEKALHELTVAINILAGRSSI